MDTKWLTKQQRRARAIALRMQGKTLAEVAEQVSASITTVWTWTRADGFPMKKDPALRKRALEMLKRGSTGVAVAAKLGVQAGRVYRWARDEEAAMPQRTAAFQAQELILSGWSDLDVAWHLGIGLERVQGWRAMMGTLSIARPSGQTPAPIAETEVHAPAP